MADVPDAPGAGVPQPRNPAERPASGSARAVSASASVPSPSRAAPEGDEAPPSAAPQARVYGRPIQPVDTDDRRPGEASPPPYPERTDRGPGGVPPSRISGRARASASAFAEPPADPSRPTDDQAISPEEPVSPGSEQFGAEPAPFGKDPIPFGGHPQPPRRPFAQPTDVAGRGRAHVPPRPEYYGELTTDISRRGPAPERPASMMPTWPPQETADADQDRPWVGGAYPGPAVPSPPARDQPGGWPPYTPFSPGENGPDPIRAEEPPRIKPKNGTGRSESGHVRMLPVLLSVVIGAVLLVGIAIGIVWLISRGSDSGFDVGAGDCVKRSGTAAVKASCGDAGAYQVVSIADSKEQCTDKRQPYVLNPTKDGKTKVLCLKPSGG